jgi:hypothetical protein
MAPNQSSFDFRKGKEVYLFSEKITPALEFTQLPIQWAPGAFSQG